MMTKPSITELDRCVDSRYTLVAMAAKRARMIGLERSKEELEAGSYEPGKEKPVSQAVDEISSGVISYVRSEAIEKAREYEEEKIAAITKFEKEGSKEPLQDESEESPVEQEIIDDPFDDSEEFSALDEALKLVRKEKEEADG